jgi:hypothetical protein
MYVETIIKTKKETKMEKVNPSITIKKIVMVEEYGSAYTMHEGDLYCTPIGEYNQIYYSSDFHSGGNIYDDWELVEPDLGEHAPLDHDAIIKALS